MMPVPRANPRYVALSLVLCFFCPSEHALLTMKQAVEALLQCGAQLTDCDNDGLTPLHSACSSLTTGTKQSEVVATLLRHGADPNETNDGLSTALHVLAYSASADHNIAVCATRLLESGNSYTAENQNGWTPFHCASSGVRYLSLGCFLKVRTFNVALMWPLMKHGNPLCQDAITTFLLVHDPEFLKSIDLSKVSAVPSI